jgi:tetratricopeptide (TPR) repeat protein
METKTKLIVLELTGGFFGWVWIIGSVASLYFLVMAIGFDGKWSSVLWTLGITILSKWLAKGVLDNQRRVAFEAELVKRGYTPEEATKEWITQYMGGKKEASIDDEREAGASFKGEWVNRAEALSNAHDLAGLLTHGHRWTQAEPGNALAWFSLGVAFIELTRYLEAIEALREALRIKPDYLAAWFSLGVAYRRFGRSKEAIEAYREALRIKRDYPAAWFALGGVYGDLGRWGEAGEALREALRIKPDYDLAWSSLAIAYAKSGNRSAALEAVKELRRYDPKKAEKLFNLIMEL